MLDSGRALEYDKTNQLHLAAVAMGRAKLERCPVAVIRESWFVGPHHLVDRPCSAPHNMYPLVPFWGYRKDRTGEPYGLIVRAMPAQDEVNLRRIKLTFLLQAKRVITDKDATNMSQSQVLEQVERPDGYIELNPDRANKTSVSDAFKVEQDFNVAAQQFQVMQDSVKLIQDTMGFMPPSWARAPPGSPAWLSATWWSRGDHAFGDQRQLPDGLPASGAVGAGVPAGRHGQQAQLQGDREPG